MTIYTGPIVDAHHHLWDLSLACHPWLAAAAGERGGLGNLAPLRRNYLPADYRRDAARQNVVASVHVEAGWDVRNCVGETTWLEGLDKAGGVAQCYVARVPLARPDAPALIEWQASFERVVGIRDILSWSEDPAQRFAERGDLMRDPLWRANLARLAAHGLVFDLMVFSHQLSEAALLVRDFPDQSFVLEHGGSPIDRTPEGMQRWREGLTALAQYPNVSIKISDLVAYDHDWTIDSLRPVALACIETFGPARSLFGSDFPVAGLHASFDDVFDAFKTIVADFSPDEQRAMFCDNACRLYRLEAPQR